MPTQIYNSGWKSPTSISLYNGGWNTVKVGYVYDTGVWRVVYPDPIIPSVSIALGPITYTSSVYVEFDLINADYIIVQLYLGSTQTSLLQSQTIDTNHNITDRAYVSFSGLSGDTTYNIKVTAYSITENSTVFLTGSFITPPSVNLTATPFEDLSGALISWTTTRQSRWRVIIRRTSDGQEVYRSSLDLVTGTTSSINAYFSALANTQYTVQLDLEFTGGGVVTTYTTFTTPNVIQPSITSLTSSSTCTSITANWSGNNYVTAEISLYEANYDTGLNRFVFGQRLVGPITYGVSTTSHTFTGLNNTTNYGLFVKLISSTGTPINSTTYLGQEWITATTTASPPDAPGNFQATSSFYGDGVSFTWTTPSANCSTIDGYTIQYKLSSSSTWSIVSNTISAGSVSFTPSLSLTANTAYDFRIFTRSSPTNSVYAYSSITTNNNPYSFSILSSTSSTTTFNSFTTNVQLKNISGGNVSLSGKSFTFTASPSGRGSFTSSTVSTNASGTATATFNTNETTGDITISASTTGLGINSASAQAVTVSLSTGLTTNLTSTRTASGYSCSQTYNSLYTYIGYAGAGSSLASGSYASSSFTMSIPIADAGVRPIATANLTAKTLSCNVNNSWTIQPSATTSVYTARTGYTTILNQTTNSPNRTASYEFLWQYSTSGSSGPWTDWQAVQSFTYSSAITNTRWCRCRVTVTGSDGDTAGGNNVKFSDTVTIP